MFGNSTGKPSGAEQMVAKLLGFTPEQMQETITSFRDTIVSVGDALKRVEEGNAQILAKLEAMENERRDNGNRGGTRKRGGSGGDRRGDGDGGGDTGSVAGSDGGTGDG